MCLKVIAIRFSDRLLLSFLKDQGDNFTVTYAQIVHSTGMSKPTVHRAMSRLECAGLISRRPGTGRSYIYKVHHDR